MSNKSTLTGFGPVYMMLNSNSLNKTPIQMQRKYNNRDLDAEGRPLARCDEFSNTELQQAIISKWPSQLGTPTTITYSFSILPYYLNIPELFFGLLVQDYFPQVLSTEQQHAFRQVVQTVLNEWSIASNFTLLFKEKNYQLGFPGNYFKNDIFFYLAGPLAKFHRRNMEGFCINKYDKNQFIRQAEIFLPTEILDGFIMRNSNKRSAYYTISHEVGHALGFQHLHEIPSIKEKLRKRQDGGRCSIMPYSSEINAILSARTIYPAHLDSRMLYLSYSLGLVGPHAESLENVIHPATTWLGMALVAYLYQYLFESLRKLKFNDEKIFADKTLHLIMNLGFFMLLGELPLWLSALYLASSLPYYYNESLPNLNIHAYHAGITLQLGGSLFQQLIDIGVGAFMTNSYLSKAEKRVNAAVTTVNPPSLVTRPTPRETPIIKIGGLSLWSRKTRAARIENNNQIDLTARM